MKKISRRSVITAMAAVSAAGVLAACGSSSSSMASSMDSSAVSSEAASSAASMDETGTHTVVDNGGNDVVVNVEKGGTWVADGNSNITKQKIAAGARDEYGTAEDVDR